MMKRLRTFKQKLKQINFSYRARTISDNEPLPEAEEAAAVAPATAVEALVAPRVYQPRGRRTPSPPPPYSPPAGAPQDLDFYEQLPLPLPQHHVFCFCPLCELIDVLRNRLRRQFSPSQNRSGGYSSQVLSDNLTRLSEKDGVKATVVLERSTGVILQTTGSLTTSIVRPATASFSSDKNGTSTAETTTSRELTGIEGLAAMVWNFMNAAGGLVQELDSEDDVKLLRLRTKKHELVIVPDTKYLLIVVHDTPAA